VVVIVIVEHTPLTESETHGLFVIAEAQLNVVVIVRRPALTEAEPHGLFELCGGGSR
jgi:hypothetical protein